MLVKYSTNGLIFRPPVRIPPRRYLANSNPILVPAKVKGWPTPWITETDTSQYLLPLYSRGWFIQQRDKAATLSCQFKFERYDDAVPFVHDIFTLCRAEKHHPVLLSVEHTDVGNRVFLITVTNSALRPPWHPSDTPQARQMKGITMRDLRFAALASGLPSASVATNDDVSDAFRPEWATLSLVWKKWASSTVHVSERHSG